MKPRFRLSADGVTRPVLNAFDIDRKTRLLAMLKATAPHVVYAAWQEFQEEKGSAYNGTH